MFKKLIILAAITVSVLYAQPNFPQLSGRVVDEVGVLDKGQNAALSQKLESIEKNSGAQVVVVILKTLDGYEIADYGYRLGRHWGIGQKGANNGVLLIYAPREKKIRIEVGYGLEGKLTDAMSHKILDVAVVPKIKQKDIFGGLDAGVSEIGVVIGGTKYSKNELNNSGNNTKVSEEEYQDGLYIVLGVAFFPLLLFVSWITRASIPNKTIRKAINAPFASIMAVAASWALFSEIIVSVIVGVLFFGIGILLSDRPKINRRDGEYGSSSFDSSGFSSGSSFSSSSSSDSFSGGGGDFGGGGASSDT